MNRVMEADKQPTNTDQSVVACRRMALECQ